jgi:hypothetical protein
MPETPKPTSKPIKNTTKKLGTPGLCPKTRWTYLVLVSQKKPAISQEYIPKNFFQNLVAKKCVEPCPKYPWNKLFLSKIWLLVWIPNVVVPLF